MTGEQAATCSQTLVLNQNSQVNNAMMIVVPASVGNVVPQCAWRHKAVLCLSFRR
jgi:hypothetical protein